MSWTTELGEWLDDAATPPTSEPEQLIEDAPWTWVRAVHDGWPTDLAWHLHACTIDGTCETMCERVFAEVVEVPIEDLQPGARLCAFCRRWALRMTDR